MKVDVGFEPGSFRFKLQQNVKNYYMQRSHNNKDSVQGMMNLINQLNFGVSKEIKA